MIHEFEGGAMLDGGVIVTFDRPSEGGNLKPLHSESNDNPRDRAAERTADNASDIGRLRLVNQGGSQYLIKDWGNDNQLPLRDEAIICRNPILPSLLETKSKIVLGQRPYLYYERWEIDAKGNNVRRIDEHPVPSEIEDFFAASNDNGYFQMAAAELVKTANVVTEFLMPVKSSATMRVAGLKAHRSKFWRKEKMNTQGNVANAFFRGDGWATRNRNGTTRDFPVARLPLWNGEGSVEVSKNFALWTGDKMFCLDDYYYTPVYRGVLSWAQLMDKIPIFHHSNLENQYFTPMHIRIRKGTFLDQAGFDRARTDEERQKILNDESESRRAWLGQVNNVFASYREAGRFIWSEEQVDPGIQKQFPDIEFVPIKGDLYDDAFQKIYETAMRAVISSVQLPSTLANIDQPGKLSAGSDVFNSLEAQRIVHTPKYRQILVEAVRIASKLNGWNTRFAINGRAPQIGFHDEHLVPMSVDKSRTQATDPNL